MLSASEVPITDINLADNAIQDQGLDSLTAALLSSPALAGRLDSLNLSSNGAAPLVLLRVHSREGPVHPIGISQDEVPSTGSGSVKMRFYPPQIKSKSRDHNATGLASL